jgi:hypothetical protein
VVVYVLFCDSLCLNVSLAIPVSPANFIPRERGGRCQCCGQVMKVLVLSLVLSVVSSFASCLVCFVLSCYVVSCTVLPCLALCCVVVLWCLVLCRLVLPYLTLCCVAGCLSFSCLSCLVPYLASFGKGVYRSEAASGRHDVSKKLWHSKSKRLGLRLGLGLGSWLGLGFGSWLQVRVRC